MIDSNVNTDWDFEILTKFDQLIAERAAFYKLDTFPNQIEMVSTEQMIDNYTSIGLPLSYAHWSFGKQHISLEKQYRQGLTGLAYELVINSNPCIAYLLEENSLTMQILVIAHACYGHNSFFKNNYLFKTWTSPDAIVDYMLFAKHFIHECEEKYGIHEVEVLIDACHALMNQGVDRYKRPQKISLAREHALQAQREAYIQSQVNELWRTLPKAKASKASTSNDFLPEPEENLLYFLEKKAPLLEPWQREIIRIMRKIAQYFYPQRQTKVMNEGWATFWHYTLLNDLYDQKHVDDKFMLEFLHHHTNVIEQPDFDSPHYYGLNPYNLGFSIFKDIKRICSEPTDEDCKWFPEIAGSDWLKTIHDSMNNFKDESFIMQFLSPKVIRDLKLFAVEDDDKKDELEITAIHNDLGYQRIRENLAQQYNLSFTEPNIQVYQVNHRTDRSIVLRHYQQDDRTLSQQQALSVLKYFHRLWGFATKLEVVNEKGDIIDTMNVPDKKL